MVAKYQTEIIQYLLVNSTFGIGEHSDNPFQHHDCPKQLLQVDHQSRESHNLYLGLFASSVMHNITQ